MTGKQKLLERFARNPKNVRPEEVDSVLIAMGFTRRVKGSHHIYTLRQHRLVIPYRKPFVLPVYVKELLRLLDELESGRED